jgi:membrane protein implicated in regulation of membrane protease activity
MWLHQHIQGYMAQSSIWWVLAGLAVAVELMTGTFYLLMLALGLVAAALAAHLGATTTVQLVLAAALGGGSVLAWRAIRKRQKGPAQAQANRDVNLDIGEIVHVDSWRSDGSASVNYRGANWTVELKADAHPTPGQHRIVEVVGSRLIVKKI